MRLLTYWDKKVEKLGIIELKMIQTAAICFALIVVKVFPQILTISIWWFVAVAVLCVIRPFQVMFVKS